MGEAGHPAHPEAWFPRDIHRLSQLDIARLCASLIVIGPWQSKSEHNFSSTTRQLHAPNWPTRHHTSTLEPSTQPTQSACKAARSIFHPTAALPRLWLVWAVCWHRRTLRESAQMAVVREFSQTTTTLSTSTIILNEGQLYMASQGAWQPPGLKLCALPTLPAPQPRANGSALLPPQVAQSSPPSPATAAAPRPETVASLPRPLPPPPASRGLADASRSRCACAVRVHSCCACTYTLLLTDPYKLTLTTATLRRPCVLTVPGPYSLAYGAPAGVWVALAPPQRVGSSAARQPGTP